MAVGDFDRLLPDRNRAVHIGACFPAPSPAAAARASAMFIRVFESCERVAWNFERFRQDDFATRFRTSSIRRLNNERDEIHRSFSSVKKSFSFSLSLLLFLQFCFSPPLFSISISLALVSPFRWESGHNKSSGFFHFDFAFYRVATLLPGNKHFHIARIEYFRERERERERESRIRGSIPW